MAEKLLNTAKTLNILPVLLTFLLFYQQKPGK